MCASPSHPPPQLPVWQICLESELAHLQKLFPFRCAARVPRSGGSSPDRCSSVMIWSNDAVWASQMLSFFLIAILFKVWKVSLCSITPG